MLILIMGDYDGRYFARFDDFATVEKAKDYVCRELTDHIFHTGWYNRDEYDELAEEVEKYIDYEITVIDEQKVNINALEDLAVEDYDNDAPDMYEWAREQIEKATII